MDHMVDSYEIYGENQPDDDSEVENEEYVQFSNKRKGGKNFGKANAGRPR